MTGQEALLKMRRAGRKPAFVFVVDGDSEYDRIRSGDWHVEPNPIAERHFAHLRVVATDVPEALDFRCVVGLRVMLMSERSEDRGRRLFNAIKGESPSFLIVDLGDEVLTHPEVFNG